MDDKKLASVSLLNGKASYSDKDPYWFRILVLLIMVTFLLAAIWILKGHAISAIAVSKVAGFDLTKILKIGKGRSP